MRRISDTVIHGYWRARDRLTGTAVDGMLGGNPPLNEQGPAMRWVVTWILWFSALRVVLQLTQPWHDVSFAAEFYLAITFGALAASLPRNTTSAAVVSLIFALLLALIILLT